MSSDPRRGTGARGERIAERHLVLRGYRILERNFRTRYGEIDLVAANERAIVFCEVKTRIDGSRFGMPPLEAIGPRKRRKVRLMAREWLRKRPPGGPTRPRRDELRFDAIGVTLARDGTLLRLEHVPGAF
jgi:putative endonuclease